MKNPQLTQKVWVAASHLGSKNSGASAMVQRAVITKAKRSVTVETEPGSGVLKTIAASLVQAHLGIAVIRIGDLQSELALLDPLAKSVLQFCRLLVPGDDYVRLYEVRTLAELKHVWDQDQAVFRHVIVIGHGGDRGLKLFGQGSWISPEMARDTILGVSTTPKVLISLCCSTGRQRFAKVFSDHERCEALVAPYGSVHGADASRFTQEFLAYALLDGKTTRTAFKKAEKSIGAGRDFRMWKHGQIVR